MDPKLLPSHKSLERKHKNPLERNSNFSTKTLKSAHGIGPKSPKKKSGGGSFS
uniref:Uncharacterized protein n=1 Tax=Arundo donax TaxID=35708 RepID=A0A0A9F270_ARUDO